MSRVLAAGALLAIPFGVGACSATKEPVAGTTVPGGCPTAPVAVLASIDQWGDIVSELGGDCAVVTTVLAGSSVDPHDFEPAPGDAVLFEGAQLIVINGGHYDEWAAKLVATSAPGVPVVDALEVSGLGTEHGEHEANPHVWYSPGAVTAVADAVTANLAEIAPDAADYFAEQRSRFSETMRPYHRLIDAIKANASGRTYAATETVFDDMAAAVGLVNRTPEGYRVASANESDPSPADLDAFLRLLDDRGVDVLIYNVQTEGSVPQQIRKAAERAGVPVVEVTETIPPATGTFEGWQVAQLTELAGALGVPG